MDNLTQPGYKHTELGWIPEEWVVNEFGEICTPSKSKFNPLVSGNKPCVELEDLTQNTGRLLGISDSKEKASLKTVFNNGDVLLGKLRPYLRKYYYAEFDGVCSTEIWALKSKVGIDSKFLFFQAQSDRIIEAANLSTGTKMPRAEWKTVSETKIPLPPLPEQTAIATALSDMDSYIQSLEALIAKKRLIKQGAMQELLTPKEGWEVRKLGELAFIEMGQSPLSEYYNSKSIGLPLIQGNADIESRKTIIRNYTSQITKRGKVGDVIMSVRAPVGEISKATFDCCLGRGVCAIRYQNDYLYHYLIFIEKAWAQFSTGSTFDSVNSQQIKELEIPIPRILKEQLNISDVLNSIDFEIESLELKLTKGLEIKQGMMQELLTGRTRLV